MTSSASFGVAESPDAEGGGGPVVRCQICGSPDTRLFRSDMRDTEYSVTTDREFHMQKCGSCGSEFLEPRPTESELPPFYPADYHAYNENHSGIARILVRMRARSRATLYGGLIQSQPGRLFDVGTGDCRHFDELREHLDLECAGIEIQPEIAARGRARGYDVIEGTLEQADLTDYLGRYDVVSMYHVLEHVVHPRQMLERSRDLLKPGGFIIGQLPTVSSWENRVFGSAWGGYHFPRHLQIPSRRGLGELLAELGFDDVSVKTAPHIQTTISLQNWLIRRGWKPRMANGKSPIYNGLLLAALPFETIAWLADNGGIVDFRARKPSG